MKLTSPQATILAAVIAVLGIVVGAFLNPFATKLINQPEPTPNPKSLAIEQIPQQVFAYAGNNNPDGGGSTFWLIYDDTNIPSYRLDYSLPADKNGYAGLAFQFTESQNLSIYKAIELTLIFGRANDEIDFYIKDIGKAEGKIHIVATGVGEMTMRYEFSNFTTVNFNAVKEVGLFSETKFSTGNHQVRIKGVRFAK